MHQEPLRIIEVLVYAIHHVVSDWCQLSYIILHFD